VATVQAERSPAEAEPAGLKANAIGFLDALVIGLASTALLHLADKPVVVVPIGGGAPNGG
jgi:hypothetical protein